MNKFTKTEMHNKAGLHWFVVSRNDKPAYYCMTEEQADKWIAIESKR
jgi:hypothetical protein